MKATFAIPAIMAAVATALPTPSGVLSSALSSTSAVSGVTKEVHSVLTVFNKSTGKNLLVELEQGFAGSLTGIPLGSVLSPVGNIVDTAADPSKLVSPSGVTSTITVALSEAEFALVEIAGTVEGLLSSLGLGDVNTVVGTVVSTVEGAASNTKRDASNQLSLTGLNGETLLVEAQGLLSTLDLSSLTGTVGTVVAQVPVVGDLAGKASELGLDQSQLFGVLGSNGASALLVQVESLGGELTDVLGGLLSGLGLGQLQQTVGTVVSTVEGAGSL